MTLNFNCICRLCLLQKDEMLPLFGEDESLPARIMTFAPVIKMFLGDSLPSQVCQQCIQLVNSSYNFKLQCESSDIALHRYLRDLNSQVETTIPVYQQEETESRKLFPMSPSDDGGDDCRDDFESVKVELKDVFESEEARLVFIKFFVKIRYHICHLGWVARKHSFILLDFRSCKKHNYCSNS
ncbi:hypothetical protein C0J52_11687 [Blattella germanica]|nr:hypothetical protein C0J52_11687 [Blattella germanica]